MSFVVNAFRTVLTTKDTKVHEGKHLLHFLMSKPVLMSSKPAKAVERGVTLSEIQTAMGRIRDSIYLSPCARSENFSQLTGNSVYLKLDNLQRTGAFKERGALNKLLTLTPEERYREMLGLPLGVRLAATEIHQAFRRSAKRMHPDAGGDAHAFLALSAARDALMHPPSKKDG